MTPPTPRPQASTGSSSTALEALEALASLHGSRPRPLPHSHSSHGSAGSSRSRSRENQLDRNSSGIIFETGGPGPSYSSSSHSYAVSSSAGGEPLPTNASTSAFTSFGGGGVGSGGISAGGSHFFNIGALGGFSFETDGGRDWASSGYSPLGSGFGFGRNSYRGYSGAGGMGVVSESPRLGSLVGDGAPASWDSFSGSPTLGAAAGVRRKKRSRGLKFVIGGGAEKGIVGIAKPREGTQSRDGTVAVAGKTFLRILKVPPRTSPLSQQGPSYGSTLSTSSTTSSSIASRRSRSRGSPVPLDRGRADSNSDREKEREDIVELHDVKGTAKLGVGWVGTGVRWGYGESSNKLATSYSNGSVALWDLDHAGTSRLATMQPHDRAVNQVLFGGPTGNYLLSAGQDGCIKLWDIRAARFSSNILKTSSPIQRIIFSPSPSQPWTLLACCSSGTFLRYDLRNLSSSGKPGTAVTDRVAGHVGAVLGVDWREGYSSSTGSQAGLGGSSFEMVPGVDIGPSGGGVGSSGFGGAGMGNAGAGSDPTREGGWVVTCGLDRTIKVWDFSLPSLSTKPVRTLFASQPVQDVAWNPDPRRGSEIISCPMLGVGIAAEGSTGSSAGGSSSSLDLAGGVTAALASGKGWKNEVELWDTRRSYLPKCSIKTEDPISSLVFNDDETIWATSKTSPTFHQYDVKSDSFSLMDSVPPVGAQWNPTGALWFAGASPGSQKGWSASGTPTNNLEESVNIETDKFKPDVSLAVVGDLDLGAGGEGGFDSREFGFLAENLVLNPWGEGGNVGVEDQAFGEVCETNAEAYRIAGRTDAVQLWKTIKIWLNEGTSILPDSPPATPPVPPPSTLRVLPVTGDAPLDIDEWLQSPVTIAPTASARRQSFNSLSREAISRSRVRSLNQSPIIHPADLPPIQKTVLDDFSEESTSSDIENKSKIASGALLAPGSIVANMVSTPAPTMDEMTSSDSEHERSTARLRALTVTATSNGSGGPPPNKLVSSLVALQSQGASRGRSGTLSQIGHFTTLAAEPPLDFADDDDFHLPPSRASSGSRLHSRRPSSSSGSDDSDGDGSHIARVRAAKIMARSRTTGESSSGTGGSGNRSSRRGSSSVSADRRPRMTPLDADAFMGQVSRRTSIDRRTATGMSRRGSAQMAAQSTDRETMPTIVKPKGPSSKELRQVEGQKYLRDARDIVKQQIVVALQDYADKGDCQLCATVCCALQKKDLPCDSLFIARVTKAYLGLLRQNKLYTAAASLIKYCSVSSINGLSQNGVVYHTACGRCGKALDQPPAFGYCAKCSNHEPTRCCICHLIVRSLIVLCATCGHGAHPDCLEAYTAKLSFLAGVDAPRSGDDSFPSTPGFATAGVRMWMWGEHDEEDPELQDQSLAAHTHREGLRELLTQCPAGACLHSPCMQME